MKTCILTTSLLLAAAPLAAEGMKFGAAIPMTGRIAFVGENLAQGAEVALSSINAAGGVMGEPVTLVIQDTKANAQSSTAAISSLVGVDKAHAILGPTSATVMSVIDRVQASGVPTAFIGSTASLDATVKGKTTWRLTHSDSEFGPAMALYAADQGYKSCAVVVDSLEGAQSLKVMIIPAFEAQGGNISRNFDVAPNQPSYRSELMDLMAAPRPDCAFFELSPDSAAQFWQNAAELDGLEDITFIATDFAISDDALSAMAPVADRVDMVALAASSIGPGRKHYRTAFAAVFPGAKEPALYSDFMWDSINVLALAAEAAQSLKAEDIAAHVSEVANAPGEICMDFGSCKALLGAGKAINYDGAAGTNDVDATGNAHSGYGVFRVDRTATEIGAVDEARISALIATLH